jgi:uncharacterized protein YrrD
VSESFRQAQGRKVVSRATAHHLGTVSHLLLTADCRHISALVLGKGRKASLVDWALVSGFGADAVMVADESALHTPRDDREAAAANGKLELLGTRTLTESGNALGDVDDVTFDPASGAVENLSVGGRLVPADAVLGSGSYAVVVTASQDPV